MTQFDRRTQSQQDCVGSKVVQFGMNQAVGQLSFDRGEPPGLLSEKPYSESTAQLIDGEVRLLIDGAFQRTLELVTQKRDAVEKVSPGGKISSPGINHAPNPFDWSPAGTA